LRRRVPEENADRPSAFHSTILSPLSASLNPGKSSKIGADRSGTLAAHADIRLDHEVWTGGVKAAERDDQ
jgi:hypothetical protein